MKDFLHLEGVFYKGVLTVENAVKCCGGLTMAVIYTAICFLLRMGESSERTKILI